MHQLLRELLLSNCVQRIEATKPKDRIISFYNCSSVTKLDNSDNPKDTFASYSIATTAFVIDTTKLNGKFKGSTIHLTWNDDSNIVSPYISDTEKATCVRE
jgi:hypothetical protein